MSNFDVGRYLNRHNVVYKGRIENKENCALVGTGILGACVWQEKDALVMQITNVDASPQAQMSSGIVKIHSELNGNSQAVLRLYSGKLTVKYDCGVTFEIYGGGSEKFEIFVHDKRKNVHSFIELCGFETFCLYQKEFRWGRCVKNPKDWENFRNDSVSDMIMISRGSTSGYGEQGVDEYEDIADETIFGYTLGLKVANVTVKRNETTLNYINAVDYKIRIANPSRFSDKDTKKECIRLLETGFHDYDMVSEKFWSDFWERTYIIHHGEQSDYIENMYYVSKYILACGMYGKMPLHFITGVFRNQGDDGITWAVAYWWYNQRCLYGWLNACGNSELLKTQFEIYLKNINKLTHDTRQKYPGSKGYVVPETMCWDGRRSFCENSPGAIVAEFINCTGEEIALKMFEYCEFTEDRQYLQEKVFPFACGVLDFAISHELSLNSDGKYEIKPGISNARESYVKIGNPVTSLGALRALLPKVISEAEREGINADFYKSIYQNLVPFQLGGYPKRFLAGNNGLNFSRSNWDDPCLELVYPFNLLGSGKEYYNEIVNNYMYRIGRDELLSCITWDNSSIWAARLGLSDNARECLKWQIAKSQIFPNGIGTDGNCKYEFSGNLIIALNETMLQSYDGVIRVFPAVFQGERNSIARFKLIASGGFIVESEFDFQKFQPKYVRITSLYGNECKIYNPYGEGNSVRLQTDGETQIMQDEILCFSTIKGKSYLLQSCDVVFEEKEIEYKENKEKKVFNEYGFLRSLGQ